MLDISTGKREQGKGRRMKSRDMLDNVKRKILRSPLRDGLSNASPSIYDEDMIDEETPLSLSEFSYNTVQSSGLYWQEVIPIEDIAATIIQAAFRAHLARRAFRALRSLVKLQALVRGVCVRKQVRIALQCMNALARLQIRVQTRQVLSKCSND